MKVCSNCKKEKEIKEFMKGKKELKMCNSCRTKINNRKKKLRKKWKTETLLNELRCNECTIIKNKSEFDINQLSCKSCKELKKNRYKNRIIKLKSIKLKDDEKICGTCHKIKLSSNFHSNSKCKKCANYKKEFYENKQQEIKNFNKNSNNTQICTKCYKKQSNNQFLKTNEKISKLCLTCRKSEVEYAWDKYKCKLCKLFLSKRKYRPYCYLCYCFVNPDKLIGIRHRFKQNYINKKINTDYPNINFEYDKIIKGGCSKRRPDWFYDFGTHSLIIECDEFQHKDNNDICENKRIMEIFQDLGNRPIVFLRFNPDIYVNKNDKKISSCFKEINKKMNINNFEFDRRYNILKNFIEFYQFNIPNKEVEIKYLFYDNFDSYEKKKYAKWKCIE